MEYSATPNVTRVTPEIIAAFVTAKRLDLELQGSQLRGPCPIHKGERDSFTMNPKTGHWFCHSACGRGGTLSDLESELSRADAKSASSSQASASNRKIVAEYDYTDELGNPVFQCVRYDPKDFRQRRRDDQNNWVWNINGVRLVPYRLHEITSAATVYICEGEKDVETVKSFGFVGTCNPMGAGKWQPEFSEFLRGKEVVIVPDDDAPGELHAISVAEGVIDLASSVKIVRVPSPAKDVSEYKAAGGTASDLASLVAWTKPLSSETLTELKERWHRSAPTPSSAQSEETQTQKLLRLADSVKLFHTPNGDDYAAISEAGHLENWQLDSRGFKNWLVRSYFQAHERPPGSQPLQEALNTLHARAQFDGDAHEVHVRVARMPRCVYLDLANEKWEAVEISPNGWRVVQQPPVHFRRPKGMAPLPTPQTGGSLADLRKFINAPTDEIFIPVVAWLVGALNSSGPYPLLCLQGEQGSAKSTLARILRDLIDPAVPALRTVPTEERDLMIGANNNWILAFDNLSGLSPSISDSFCRLSTGGGFSTRQRYSDSEEALFDTMRPIILNGIDDVATRQDLVDRSLIVSLPAISDAQRRSEQRLLEDFRLARPALLGALCNAVSTALRNFGSISVPALPRMADFATWILAAEPDLPWQPGEFLLNYATGRKHAVEIAIEGDVVASEIHKFAKQQNSWSGTASDLLDKVEKIADEKVKRSRSWPKSAAAFSNRVRRAATFLRAADVDIAFSRKAGTGQRLIEVRLMPTVTTVTAVTPAMNSCPTTPLPSDSSVTGADTALTTTSSPISSAAAHDVDARDDRDTRIPTMSEDIDADLGLAGGNLL
jgi:hypothetical protein